MDLHSDTVNVCKGGVFKLLCVCSNVALCSWVYSAASQYGEHVVEGV